jgi:hypothetical protein
MKTEFRKSEMVTFFARSLLETSWARTQKTFANQGKEVSSTKIII